MTVLFYFLTASLRTPLEIEAVLIVERGEGLTEQQDVWIHDQCADQRHPAAAIRQTVSRGRRSPTRTVRTPRDIRGLFPQPRRDRRHASGAEGAHCRGRCAMETAGLRRHVADAVAQACRTR